MLSRQKKKKKSFQDWKNNSKNYPTADVKLEPQNEFSLLPNNSFK